MISPDERPETTTPETETGPETTPDVSTGQGSTTGRVPTALAAVKTWLRSPIDPNSAPSLPQRIPPKMRVAQLGTAFAAVAVLGTVLGGTGTTPEQDVQLAAESAHTSQAGQSAPGQSGSVDPATSHSQAGSKDEAASASTPGGMVSNDRDQAKDRKTGQRQSREQDNGSRGKSGSEPKKDTSKGSADQQDGEHEQDDKGEEKQEKKSAEPQQPAPEPAEDQLDAWINEASAVLESKGYDDDVVNEDHIRTIILKESGGDPSAINNWDSNAAKGTPSKGLMQTIDPTFESYALPGHGNVWDPVDNIIAATRYSVDRYGSVSSVPGITGMQSGGSYEGY